MDQLAPAPMRRAPSQRRSRERVERILAVSSALIGEQGSDAMRMGEVAEKAGISIGSLYQYFPDKGAIIRTLAERYNELGRHCIEEELAKAGDMNGLKAVFAGLIDTYYALFLAEPVMRDIWSGTQADKHLRQIDLDSSRANGALLATVLTRLRPDADPARISSTAFLIMYLGEAAMRLAISVGREEGLALVETYKRTALRELMAI
jgi:AcrR family transcriptional regulator